MKKQFFILSISALMSVGYAKSQCTTAVNNSGTTGTQYYVPRYSQTGAPCLQNSSIFDNGSVGIGTTTPATKLDVNGSITAASGYYYGSVGVLFGSTTNTYCGVNWTNLSTGNYNACLGYLAGVQNVTGSNNTYLGYSSGRYNQTGSSNTTVGYQAGGGADGYSNNSFFGYKAGYATNVGTNNVFMGYQAGTANTYSGENVAVGYNALATQSYGSVAWSSYNVAVGNGALYSNQPTSTTTGYHNAAFGDAAGYDNTTGILNTFIGSNAGRVNTTGGYNTFLGYQSGYGNTTASRNTFAGYAAGYYTTTGDTNTFYGVDAGLHNTTGKYNTALGNEAGNTYSTGNNDTYIGYGADANGNSYSNATAIGNGATVTGSNKIYLGNTSVTYVWCQPGVWNGSDLRIKDNVQANIPGLAFIKLLKPVSYHYNVDRENQILAGSGQSSDSSKTSSASQNFSGKYDIQKIQYTGFIAQSVDSAARKIGYDFSGVYKPQDESKDIWGLNYSSFIPSLVEAIQELSKTDDSLKAEIATLKKTTESNPENANNSQQISLTSSNVILYQNQPNPFSTNTVIRYFIPENTSGNAYIIFYDTYGNEINKREISQKGPGQIEVNSDNLASGIYSYSLVIDNKIIDTKKMEKMK
ncbi:MAG TPA: tail fiber domain-containing protein [Puia sp.]|nr:tail fiber domain-containing protein [Puia sp.]